MRGVTLAVALALGGCAESAEQYLQNLPPPDFDALDASVRPAPDALAPVGPTLARDTRVALVGVAQPRGLAWDGADAFYTTDRADDRLVEVDPNGGVREAWPLPERGVRALAWHDGRLYVGYSAVIYAFDDGVFEPVAEARGLRGMTSTADGLVTLQSGGTIYVHRDGSLAPRYELGFSGSAGLLVRVGDHYLVYRDSQMLDGAVYQAICQVADATSTDRAEVAGLTTLFVDASHVAGLAQAGPVLWALGGGNGVDRGHLVALRPISEGL